MLLGRRVRSREVILSGLVRVRVGPVGLSLTPDAAIDEVVRVLLLRLVQQMESLGDRKFHSQLWRR